MKHIKDYWWIIPIIIILVLGELLVSAIKNMKTLEAERNLSVENYKYYNDLFNDAAISNRALRLTVEQLNYSRDSILIELNDTKRSLKIKDTNLQSLQYLSSTFDKCDTITITDTLFRDPQVAVDTTILNEWYSMNVKLNYPSTIAIHPKFTSVKHVIVSTKKETINPPKKFFLFRWFQKKHTVLNIDIVEQNPYIKNQNSRYIEVVR